MKKHELLRNITIGITDGLTIPLALAAGLSSVVNTSFPIAVACAALSVAGAIPMAASAYLEGKKLDTSREQAWTSSLIIGISYITGGIITSLPYLFTSPPLKALQYAAMICLPALFVAGYYESKVNGANSWAGALRVMLTGAVAGAAAFFVAKIFF